MSVAVWTFPDAKRLNTKSRALLTTCNPRPWKNRFFGLGLKKAKGHCRVDLLRCVIGPLKSDNGQTSTGNSLVRALELSKGESGQLCLKRNIQLKGEDMNKLVEQALFLGEVPASAKDKDKDKEVYTEDFEAFFRAYPRRKGGNPKHLAFKAYKKVVKVVPAERLRASLTGYWVSLGDKVNTEYVLMASTYLNQKRYEEFLDFGLPERPKPPPFKPPQDTKKKKLYELVGESNYRLWFDPCSTRHDGKLLIKNKFKRDWTAEKFMAEIYAAGFSGVSHLDIK